MSDRCSFCSRRIGESSSESVLRGIEEAIASGHEFSEALAKHAEKIRRERSKEPRVQLLLPGPDDILMCDLCAELYAETARREKAARA